MISSRIRLLGAGCVAVGTAAGVACSSSSPSAGPMDSGSTSSSGGSSSGSSGGSSSGAIVDGDGGACTITYPHKSGTFIAVNVTWPGTTATVKGQGIEYLWLLGSYSVDSSNKITGTNKTCGLQSPDVPLSATGSFAVGAPMGTTALVQSRFPPSSWDEVPTSPIVGTLGGTNINSSFETDPTVTLNGITTTDPLADPTKPWPGMESELTKADLTYADGGAYVTGMGHPGIHGLFNSMSPYYLSSSALSMTSPKVDQLWIVSRTQIGLYGTRKTCTDVEGNADVKLIQNRIVGCEIVNDGGPCSEDQYAFIDSNTTQYVAGSATFKSKDLPDTATCADVLSAFPVPAK